MPQHDGNDYYVVVAADSPFAVSGLAECVSSEWRLFSARAEAAVAHIVRLSKALALLPVRGWVLDPTFFVGLLPALTAVSFDPAAKVWHDPLREAAGYVDDALLVVTPDHVLATKGFDLYQAVNHDLRLHRLDPFFDDLLKSVDSYDVAAAAGPAPAATLDAGMSLRSSAANAPTGVTPRVIAVTHPPLPADAFYADDKTDPGALVTFAMLAGPQGSLTRLSFLSAVAGPRFSPSARRGPFGKHDLFVSALRDRFASSSRLSHISAGPTAPPSLIASRLSPMVLLPVERTALSEEF